MARKYFGIVVLLTVAILAGNAVAQKSNEIAGDDRPDIRCQPEHKRRRYHPFWRWAHV